MILFRTSRTSHILYIQQQVKRKHRFKEQSHYNFQPDIDLNRDPEDGLRSWSLKVDSVKKANSIENNIPPCEI